MEFIRKNFKWYFLIWLVIITVIVWYAVFWIEAYSGKLLFIAFDVGQGDGLFIQTDNGNQVLIDGGPSTRILDKLGKVMPFWDRSIDLLILTHPHADHLDGLLEVLKRYNVDMVLETKVNHTIPEYAEWHNLLKKKDVKVVTAKTGQRVRLSGSVYLDILTPFKSFEGQSPKNIHDSMIVSKLVYGSTTILLMGDAEKSIEYYLLYEFPEFLNSDLLKVGHHGSKTSTSEEFLKAVSPELMIISVGKKNRYGHPHQGVIETINKFDVNILRTDIEGDIRLLSDGKIFRRSKF